MDKPEYPRISASSRSSILGTFPGQRSQLRGRILTVIFLVTFSLFIHGIVPANATYQAHNPIVINGNTDFNSSNGVTGGSGTSSDPYTIDGWDISTSFANGIDVRNTDAYFLIRNVNLHSETTTAPFAGVNLYNVANADVSSNTLSDDSIIIRHSFNFSVIGNTILQGNNHDGISIDQSSSFQVAGNRLFNDNGNGIVITDSFSLSITDNYVRPQGWAIGVKGIDVSSDPLHSSSSILISRNTVYGQIDGISLVRVGESTLSTNTILGANMHGAVLTDSTNITMMENSFWYPRQGLFLNHTQNTLVFHNNFRSRSPALDYQGSSNLWDNGYPDGGNYWSTFTAIDNCSGPNQDVCTGPDGIADTPYVFDFNQDSYPLMNPVQVLTDDPLRADFVAVLSNNPQSSDWTVMNPTWTTMNGYLDGSGVSAQIISTASYPTNRTVQDRAKTLSSGDALWKTAYLIGKYVDFYDKVTLLLETDGTVIVQVWQGGTNHNYVYYNSGLSPYDWHTFKLVFAGNNAYAYVDGTLYITATDPIFGALGACPVSLASWGPSESQFDSVMIS